MKNRNDLGILIRRRILPEYRLKGLDIGADSRLKKNGFDFSIVTYEVEGIGHLCCISMKAMLGLMKMETIVLAPFEKDMPLLNLDWVGVPGKETQIVELYDTQLAPYPAEKLREFEAVRERDADLTDYKSKGAHSYDSIKYSESYQKTGKGISGRLSQAAQDYINIYVRQLSAAEPCDRADKQAAVRRFTDMLIGDGGTAVDQMTKLFGEETAERVIRSHMYGV